MSDEAQPPTHNPITQFRLRSLLMATTAIAVLAAIAGPYYRLQSPEAQSNLLILWAWVLVFGAIGMWSHWRAAWHLPTGVGDVRFMLWTTRARYSLLGGIPGKALLMLLMFGFIAFYSTQVVRDTDHRSATLWTILIQSWMAGIVTGGILFDMTRRPAYLGDLGVKSARGYGSWQHIRHAQWLLDRPGVLKLRRLDGDICVDVPMKLRDEVEAFVREKTAFVDAAAKEVNSGEIAPQESQPHRGDGQ